MKKTIRTVALIAVLGTMAVGCQKETIVEPQASVAEIGTVYTVQYAVDGVLHQETLIGEQAWSDFLHRMLALAEQGYEVTVINENSNSGAVSGKEVVTFSTSNQEEAFKWCAEMLHAGYAVTMTYDEERHMYNCVAVK